MKKIFAVAAVLTLAPALAHAAPNSMRVHTADLDLSRSSDMEILEKRIAAAADKYCGADRRTTGTRLISAGQRECVREVKAAAMKQFAARIESESKGG
ncbi:UrcA family protein [Qipengyuania sp. MTN3-11]|uniref:UrcA family protein n=1 Tax=Qipengyuania sp. MTN3-11 TaxID=3056557 RepID=UPI0036F28715